MCEVVLFSQCVTPDKSPQQVRLSNALFAQLTLVIVSDVFSLSSDDDCWLCQVDGEGNECGQVCSPVILSAVLGNWGQDSISAQNGFVFLGEA